MSSYLLGVGIACGAVVSWQYGPEKAPALLARWLPRAGLTLLAMLVINFLFASKVLTLLAGHGLSVVLGLFAGGMTQVVGMAVTRRGLRDTGNRYSMLLAVCAWVIVFAAFRW